MSTRSGSTSCPAACCRGHRRPVGYSASLLLPFQQAVDNLEQLALLERLNDILRLLSRIPAHEPTTFELAGDIETRYQASSGSFSPLDASSSPATRTTILYFANASANAPVGALSVTN